MVFLLFERLLALVCVCDCVHCAITYRESVFLLVLVQELLLCFVTMEGRHYKEAVLPLKLFDL